MAVLVGALACAGNTAREADTDESAAARDTTTTDTLGGQQNPSGYRGMERDTTMAPTDSQPSDSFLQNQGTGTGQDTSGYSGMERVDTTGQQGNQQGQVDTTNMQGQTDTTSQMNTDTTGAGTGAYESDTSATGAEQPTGDTTGYDQSGNQSDTTTSR
jgi:hypothetical protein